jgi:tetrahydromethanopterin S-methyltransferase subunit G
METSASPVKQTIGLSVGDDVGRFVGRFVGAEVVQIATVASSGMESI